MSTESTLAPEAEREFGELRKNGGASGWAQADLVALFQGFDRWLQHPELLDPEGDSLLRITVLNELTWLIPEPIVGELAWDYLSGVAKRLSQSDPHELCEAWRIATFELAAEPPEDPAALRKLFSLAGDVDTRWAVFAAYEMFPWRLRPHARRYSGGLVSDEDCDQWLEGRGLEDDEILMDRTSGDLGSAANAARTFACAAESALDDARGHCWLARCWPR